MEPFKEVLNVKYFGRSLKDSTPQKMGHYNMEPWGKPSQRMVPSLTPISGKQLKERQRHSEEHKNKEYISVLLLQCYYVQLEYLLPQAGPSAFLQFSTRLTAGWLQIWSSVKHVLAVNVNEYLPAYVYGSPFGRGANRGKYWFYSLKLEALIIIQEPIYLKWED